jgi:hypothetical protein
MPPAHSTTIDLREIRHFHLFCGLGGGARGFNRGSARVGNMQAAFRCIGGIDVSPAAIRDFEHLAGVPGTVLDLFDADQYAAFHCRPPPIGWRPATPHDIQRAAGGQRPHIVFLSAPCKGFSGLLAEALSVTPKSSSSFRQSIPTSAGTTRSGSRSLLAFSAPSNIERVSDLRLNPVQVFVRIPNPTVEEKIDAAIADALWEIAVMREIMDALHAWSPDDECISSSWLRWFGERINGVGEALDRSRFTGEAAHGDPPLRHPSEAR